MRLSIATKISLAFSVMVLVFALVIMASIWRTQRLFEQIQALNRSIIPLSLMLSDAQNDLKNFDVVLAEDDPETLRRALLLTRMMTRAPQRVFGKLKRASSLTQKESFSELAPPERQRILALQTRLLALTERSNVLDADTHQLQTLLHQYQQAPSAQLKADIFARRAALRAKTEAIDLDLTRARNDLRISTDLALVRASESERDNLLALAVMAAIALAITLAMFGVALLTVRPLRELTEGAKRVARGDYHPLRIPGPRFLGKDELATLTQEFNSMASALLARDNTLREQHAALLKSERLAAIGRMTSLITHELRNPLSSIGLNAEMVVEQLLSIEHEERAEIIAHLETITREVDRLRDITEEYLVYARLPEPRFARLDIAELLEHLVDFHEWEWSQQGVEVCLDIDQRPLMLNADANQLRQAFLNLIKNATEATQSQGRVEVRVRQSGEMLHVHVEDWGEGIAQEIKERIFEPFFTSKAKGTGLGLAMTQQIIEEHHGLLTHTQPEHHQGSQFTVSLPFP